MSISELFIKRPIMTTLVMAAILIFGIFAYTLLPVSDLPNVDFPTIQVIAQLPGASPETMASSVATPLEKQFSTIAGIDSMTSTNALGSANITIQFNLSRSLDGAALDVQSAISKAASQLPPEMPTPPSFQKVNPADQPILYLAVSSPTLKLSDVDEAAETTMAQNISMVNGVAQVSVFGSQKYAVRVQVDQRQLASLRGDGDAFLHRRRIVRADLRSDAVLERRDDLPARGVVLGIRTENQGKVQRQAHRVAFDLHVALLHDVEQAHLDLSRQIGQLVDGEDAAVGARQQPVVHGELAGELVPSLGRLDGIDVPDQVGDGHVRGGQFLDVALLGRKIGDRRLVALAGDQLAAALADGRIGVVVDLTAADVRRVRVEQRRECAQDAALGLSAQPEQDEVMPREDRVHDLWHYRIVEADDAREDGFLAAKFFDQVLAQLVLHAPRAQTLFCKLTVPEFT